MNRMKQTLSPRKGRAVGLAIILVTASLAGCTEVNLAIDSLLGKTPPALSAAASDQFQWSMLLTKKKTSSERSPVSPSHVKSPSEEGAAVAAPGKATGAKAGQEETAGQSVSSRKGPALKAPKGKRAAAGALPPQTKEQAQGVPAPPAVAPATFIGVVRDPFKAPTEILPSECPPSMPLCKFDRSQLKLVGVIQVAEGHFKGMVEDPDGRGYFVTPGMQIGGATVTQVTQKGVTLHLSRTGQDVVLPLFAQNKE